MGHEFLSRRPAKGQWREAVEFPLEVGRPIEVRRSMGRRPRWYSGKICKVVEKDKRFHVVFEGVRGAQSVDLSTEQWRMPGV